MNKAILHPYIQFLQHIDISVLSEVNIRWILKNFVTSVLHLQLAVERFAVLSITSAQLSVLKFG